MLLPPPQAASTRHAAARLVRAPNLFQGSKWHLPELRLGAVVPLYVRRILPADSLHEKSGKPYSLALRRRLVPATEHELMRAKDYLSRFASVRSFSGCCVVCVWSGFL